jgi:hypothetical protein
MALIWLKTAQLFRDWKARLRYHARLHPRGDSQKRNQRLSNGLTLPGTQDSVSAELTK